MSNIDYHLIDLYKDGIVHLKDQIGSEVHYMQIVILNSLKDFNINNYDRTKNVVVKFKDCGHVFTFGDVDAYLDDINTLHGRHVVSTDLYCWAIAFGNGNAINKSHGPAITFGKGNAYSFNKSITFGTGDAIVETTLSYKYNSLNLKESFNEDTINFYDDIIKHFKTINQFSYAETYGMGHASYKHETIIDGVVCKSENKRPSVSHVFAKERDSWSLPGSLPGSRLGSLHRVLLESIPYLNINYRFMGIMMCKSGRSSGFNTNIDNIPVGSKIINDRSNGTLKTKNAYGQRRVELTLSEGCGSSLNQYNTNPYQVLEEVHDLRVAPVFNDNPIKLEYTGRFNT